MSGIFNSVPVTKVSRSTFNLDHENEISFNFGGLYPILCQTVLPGDKMSLGIQSFLRTVPLLSPVMHRNNIKVDAFFVPMRLIWDNYEKWLQCTDATIKMPKVMFGTTGNVSVSLYNSLMGVGSLSDYLGFASVPATTFPVSSNEIIAPYSAVRTMNALPFRSYQLIYDYYYRNKALELSIFDPNHPASILGYDIKSNSDTVLITSGTNAISDLFKVKNRSWRRDAFTSALPEPQKGNPVLMPTGDIIPSGNLNVALGANGQVGDLSVQNGSDVGLHDSTYTDPLKYNSGLKIDSPTIEDFRYAEVLDEYEEALARSGSGNIGSFKEWLFAIWRTLSPDARLDRPEYLGGYRGPIQISEVPQTSSATVTSPQGTLAGKGLSVGGQLLFRNKHFKEPGYLMVIMSVVPKSSYFQGDPRQFLYDNCFDFPNPYFANLGEQEVLSQEVVASHALMNPSQSKTFGYQVRNYEMKQIPDSIHGALRDSLMYWHEARYFNDYNANSGITQLPVNLNDEFIKMHPSDVSRIFPSSESSDKLIGEFYFSFRAKRSLPYYGVPRVGHNK